MKAMTKTFILICLASTSLALPARAGDVPDVVQVLLDNWKNQTQVEPTYASIDTDDSGNITISKLAVAKAAEGSNPGVNLTVEEISLTDVSDAEDGLYEIGNATFSGVKLEVAGPQGMAFSMTMPEGSAESWYVKDPGDTPAPEDTLRAAMNVAKKMSSGKITIEAMGQTITSDGYESTWDGDPATGAGSFNAKLANTVIPESAMAQIDPTGALKNLGYSGLTFDITGDGKMDIADGKMGLDFRLAYIGKDMGALKVSLGAGDIPLSVYAEMQQAQASGKQPDFSKMMPELQGISLGGFSFRFEDNSITKKILPMIAAMQGMDQAAMLANAGAMVQMGLMQLKNQAFTDQVVGAVNGFLKDPKSITIALKPASPIKVQELMTLNPANPGEAITKLGVSVTAND